MKTILFILAITLSACVPAHAQSSRWYELTDSLGNNLYTDQGYILLSAITPFTETMEEEINVFIEERSYTADNPSKPGVQLIGDGWMAFRNSKTEKWTIAYTNK